MILTGQISIMFEDPAPQEAHVILYTDGVSQEGEEDITIRLVPSPETSLTEMGLSEGLESTSKNVYFKDEIDITIEDVDGIRFNI